ncbi:hypothetical protein PAPYR_472 [Paratrimastix pyriformis]|uniref:Uncharacterized protein n=1 Tax=Paratrimastix pyriformis TaxID=342808 RepID=A0ABQ8UUH7_9EUKA|nr:hypothetical protein PAPYR_472 [Paratrimastix pyriformis]
MTLARKFVVTFTNCHSLNPALRPLALVGPCTNLIKLTLGLRGGHPPGWLRPFADTRLVLEHLSNFSGLLAERILTHLPGLVEPGLPTNARRLFALARSCRVLQVLRCRVSSDFPGPWLNRLEALREPPFSQHFGSADPPAGRKSGHTAQLHPDD